MRGKGSSLAACAVAGIVLAQLAGCSGCVKEEASQSEPAASATGTGTGRKPLDPRAVDKRLSQFGAPDGGADASTD